MNKELMRQFGFNKEVRLVEQGICPFCQKKSNILDFSDEKSKKEFKISGLCQECQDKTFGEKKK